jgi:hypothetical protein
MFGVLNFNLFWLVPSISVFLWVFVYGSCVAGIYSQSQKRSDLRVVLASVIGCQLAILALIAKYFVEGFYLILVNDNQLGENGILYFEEPPLIEFIMMLIAYSVIFLPSTLSAVFAGLLLNRKIDK